MPKQPFLRKIFLLLLAGTLLIAACGSVTEVPAPTGVTPPPSSVPPTSTPTLVLPSPTPVPLAARVNGEEITLAEFEAELARYQAAIEDPAAGSASDARQKVLDELVDQVLLSQGAREAGFSLSENEVQARLEALAEEAGGDIVMAEWLAAYHYTEESFLYALERSLAVAWMRDSLIASVPSSAEQVHARQILLHNEEQAREVLARLGAGEDFLSLATEFEPLTSGDLGWFPRGYLLEPAVEEAAFALEPEAYSRVIETRLGFHLVQLVERDPDRPLDPDALLTLQRNALRDWLEARRSESQIQTLLPD
jgi:peptidyl-prolyl cis-trans isomerase C